MAANVCTTSQDARSRTAVRRRSDAVQSRRLGYAFAGVATLVLASTASGAARAQAGGAAPTMAPATLGGPSQPLTIGIQERTTYDSDAARGSETAAAIRGLQSSDVIYSPSITVNYVSPNPRRGLALRGYFGYDYYQRNRTLRREQIDVSAAGNATFGKCQLGGQLSFDRGQSGLEDLTLLVTKNTIQSYTVSASETCVSTAGLTESVQVLHSGVTNTAALLVDYDTTGVSGSVGYSNHTLGNVSLVVDYSKTDYKNQLTSLSGTPNSLDVTSVGVQFSRPIGRRLAGQLGVYYSTSNTDLGSAQLPGESTSFNGVTANAGLTYQVGPRLHLTGSLFRGVQATIRQGAAFAVTDRVDLGADYTLSSRIQVNLGGSWSKETFKGLDPLIQEVAPNRVDLWMVGGGVTFKVGRKSALSADVHHEESKTDLALFNFKDDRVSLTISTSF
ncbi:MAG: gelF [Phenylobacterium sp.]|nr:gelF [Phenylobacterium sp.]